MNKNTQSVFPFTAIVGQEPMKKALIYNAIDPKIGGVLIRGERGSGKSTAARALARLLPPQPVISGCPFGCSPEDPDHRCDSCLEKYGTSTRVPRELRPMPFVNLPVSVTEDRLVGTLDFEKAITDGKKSFEPGIFAAVNRGILYVDEVNLLDDHVVDTLLDAAAMGMNHVEREGISFSHPSRFFLIGTMNPEEGDLRPQLLDRFALSVEIHGEEDPGNRVEIIRRCIAFEENPQDFSLRFQQQEQELSERILEAGKKLPQVRYSDRVLGMIAELTAAFQLEGHRADLVILKTARAAAAFQGHSEIAPEDIARAAELAIPHRRSTGHHTAENLSPQEMQTRIADILRQSALNPEGQAESSAKKKALTGTSQSFE